MKKLAVLGLVVLGISIVGCQKKPPAQGPEVGPPPPTQNIPETTGPIYTPGPLPPPTPGPGMSGTGGTRIGPADAGTVSVGGKRTHVVKPGETLWKIMPQYYDKASKANEDKIVAANPGLDPNKLKVGQQIVIPD